MGTDETYGKSFEDSEEAEMKVPESELQKIFELADEIAQMKVRYQSDPLRMANETISKMQRNAEQIAATVGHHIKW
jgi:hypothetical protein